MRQLVAGCVLSFIAGCAVAAVASSPGAYFESVSSLNRGGNTFKDGYVAGVYDTASQFAEAARGNGINNQKAIALFQCLDRHGDKLGEFRTWADTVWSNQSSSGSAVKVLVDRCL